MQILEHDSKIIVYKKYGRLKEIMSPFKRCRAGQENSQFDTKIEMKRTRESACGKFNEDVTTKYRHATRAHWF